MAILLHRGRFMHSELQTKKKKKFYDFKNKIIILQISTRPSHNFMNTQILMINLQKKKFKEQVEKL